MRIVDNRGLNCPEPVINTKRALDENSGEPIVSIVDNEVSKSNVLKFARSQGFHAEVRQEGMAFFITLSDASSDRKHVAAAPVEFSPHSSGPTLYLVTADEFGRGNAELGRALMKTFLYALAETGERSNHIVFLHGGVHLTCEDSPVVTSLQKLQSSGWSITTCGACLDFYQLKDKLVIGEITNMYSIVELMRSAAKVITL
ncbi:MAG: hypothetical protein DDT20_00727 [Firmicutes bacterium]|nr:hypothetical protein [Bacillota bacterium]